MENNFKGKHKFIRETQLSEAPYNDTDTYKYVFDYIDKYENLETGSTYGKMFFVKDRINNVSYIRQGQVSKVISNFGNAIALYMAALETKRASW
ncbi:MAG: hypothetical protein GQ574_21230 [Crocinitomix sp.]|nr:hypothetical protein [Crocinitomix sp.]